MSDRMKPFRITRMVLGIIGIVLSVLVLFQSCTVFGLSAMIAEAEGAGSGLWGTVLSLLFMAGAIVQLITRKSNQVGAFVATIILFALAAVIGFAFSGCFPDLMIWAIISLIYAIVELVFVIVIKKKHI